MDIEAIPVKPVQTIKLNKQLTQKRKLDTVLKVENKDLVSTDPTINPYFEQGLSTEKSRGRRDLTFRVPGETARRAEKRRKEKAKEMQNIEYQNMLLTEANRDSEMPSLPREIVEDPRKVPDWEWWDLPFLKGDVSEMKKNCDAVIAKGDSMAEIIQVRNDRITHYVHCPVDMGDDGTKKKEIVVPIMLTKKETKKLRRQKRAERMDEKREKIAMGLLQPDAPKVKVSNMMQVLATEAVADPTRIEQEVRKQVEERRRKHEMNNLVRKKTKVEKREKEREKLEKDRQEGTMAAVYRVVSMDHPQHRFKVDVSARQLSLTGTLLLFPNMNVVVVEGGRKALRKYKKLMLRRIDWDAEVNHNHDVTQTKEVEMEDTSKGFNAETGKGRERKTNKCVMVWEGPISTQAFSEFSTVRPRSSKECKEVFRRRNVEHYWDLCLQGNPLGNVNLGQWEME